eukprot:CAMPEP_0206136186 /NCGR_PEP_ID=MMETSP1473-20131121/1419_1 /ASSEMBLY_ACC=CAM_ASM_001109 /TAXON_ID=1461547 /ORGANISM="Stichococcus sp, Strain RCC1054" /LENGTH=585 /DNA_ID=CAMNT_0053528527 /DNA_START=221 /DNA_END=1978 /DNA_ORIENTATION=+
MQRHDRIQRLSGRKQATGEGPTSLAAIEKLRRAAEAAANSVTSTEDKALADAKQLISALEAELRAADEEALQSGVSGDTPVPLSQLPSTLFQPQSPASPPPPAQQRQQQEQQQPAERQLHPNDTVEQRRTEGRDSWEHQQQQQQQQQQTSKSRAEPAAEPIIGSEMSDWAPLPAPAAESLPAPPPGEKRAEGSGHEILLQAFNWESANGNWWGEVERAAPDIAAAGFTVAWLPPPTASVSRQGYMPTDLYNLDSGYGNKDALKRCIKALQGAGVKALADIVINHRCAQKQDANGIWNVFGGKLAWDATAVVGDDWKFKGKGANSSGDSFGAAPNIDHTAEVVKSGLSEWLRWLRSDIGFDGWRLDFVRGYAGEHAGDYAEASSPDFVVAEFWDALAYRKGVALRNQDPHRSRTVNWMKAAGGTCTAFDMTTKGILHQAFETGDLSRLRDSEGKPPGVLGWWPSHTCTFLENHDTGSTQGHWRFPGNRVEAGHAYIMTHPGTPCVFWDHWSDSKLRDIITRLVALRKKHGINCRSNLEIHEAGKELYVAETDGKILVKIGSAKWIPDGDDWKEVDSGKAWTVYERA